MKLSNENIADAVEEIQNFFQQTNISERDKLRVNLIVEEVFLRNQTPQSCVRGILHEIEQ